MTEELLLRMGFNGEPVKRGLLDTEMSVKGIEESFKTTFVKSGSTVRDFRKLLHELGDASPALGAALELAIDPVGGTLQTIAGLFKKTFADIADWHKQLDDMGKAASRPFSHLEEALRGASKEIAKNQAEFSAWQKAVESGSKADSNRIKERLAEAKLEAKGDEEAFLRKKIQIAQEEELAAKEKLRADLSAATAAAAALNDKERIARTNAEAEELNALIKRREELKALIPDQETKIQQIGDDSRKVFGMDIGLPEGPDTFGVRETELLTQQTILNGLLGEKEAITLRIAQLEEKVPERLAIQKKLQTDLKQIQGEVMSDKERADAMAQAQLEAQAALDALLAKKRKEDLAERIALEKVAADGDEVKFLAAKLALEEEARAYAEKNGLVAEERQLKNDILLTTEQLANAEQARLEKQRKFNQELGALNNQRAEEINSRYRPTLDQVIMSDPWMTDPWLQMGGASETAEETRTRWLKESEDMFGDRYLQQFSDEARDLQALEERAAILFRMEGPDSQAFKEATGKIQNLKDDLSEAGLLKEDPLKSIDRHIEELLEKAKKDGLVIQPKNGK